MTVSYFTHVRCLGNGSGDDPYRYSFEFLPEINLLLRFINNESACVRLDQTLIAENINKERWANTTLIARNKHIAVIHTNLADEDFQQQLSAFSPERPPMPYAFTFEDYINNVISHRAWLIQTIKNIDELFNENDIFNYINNLNFVDDDFTNIKDWIINILNNNNILYPSLLCSNDRWLFEGWNTLNNKLNQESNNSDIYKMFNAFEVYNMDCILEVI